MNKGIIISALVIGTVFGANVWLSVRNFEKADQLNKTQSAIQKEVAQLEKQSGVLKTHIEKVDQDRQNLVEPIAQITTSCVVLGKRIQQVDDARAALVSPIKELASGSVALGMRIESVHRAQVALAKPVKELEGQYQALGVRFNKADRNFKTLESITASLGTNLEDVRTTSQDMADSVDSRFSSVGTRLNPSRRSPKKWSTPWRLRSPR